MFNSMAVREVWCRDHISREHYRQRCSQQTAFSCYTQGLLQHLYQGHAFLRKLSQWLSMAGVPVRPFCCRELFVGSLYSGVPISLTETLRAILLSVALSTQASWWFLMIYPDFYLTSYISISSRWIVDLTVEGKTIQPLEKNNGGCILISMQANTF